jgi:hypothetical protein
VKKKKPSRAKGIQKEVNETDSRFEFLSDWVALDLHFELRIGMPDAKVVQARIADANIKSLCSYCGLRLTESEHLELEVEYQGADTELYNTLLLCREIEPCKERGFFINADKLSRYLTPSLIEHYRNQTLSKAFFSPLNAIRKQSKSDQ